MKKEDKQLQSLTREERRKADALQKLMRRYKAGDKLTVEELQLLDQVVIPDEGTDYDTIDSESVGQRILNSVYTNTSSNKGKKKSSGFFKQPIPRTYQYGVAAAFFVLIGVWLFLKFQTTMTSHSVELTALHEVEKYTLPDGSTVYLNRGSQLSYDEKLFDATRREIHLTGEAFFEVTKNPEKPFIVYGGETMTTVRGTSFNVKAYTGVRKNVISVREGCVEVATTEHKKLATLTRNLQMTWDIETQTYRQDSIDWRDAAAWKDGKLLVFNSAGLDEIKLKIEQCYGTSVSIDGLPNFIINFHGSYPADDGGMTLLQELNDIYGLHSKKHAGKIEFYR
ncbi:FecR family protein [Dysgonomonas sp. BGC7]|uniref:FecR family protein n=1 Tax=Dysgonomonas sp. BGC7 TaxID=1658008 RepID=UPI00068336E4|nr:FecR domain-containing protein [Dysgonomonas sp. BGC7]MBD8387776.1 FecR domain-containing protein [Dysgonomonas sp. BGC7]